MTKYVTKIWTLTQFLLTQFFKLLNNYNAENLMHDKSFKQAFWDAFCVLEYCISS